MNKNYFILNIKIIEEKKMLTNNVTFIYVNERNLEIFKNTSCEIGMLIGSVSLYHLLY